MSKRPPSDQSLTYRSAGVDIAAADEFVDAIGPRVRRTYGPRVLKSHGGFAGAFRLDYDEKLFAKNYREPVLVSCTDGVGSKLLIALECKTLDTIGIDLVAMNVNDLVCCGAEPLFFLDYIAVNKIVPKRLEAIVGGIARGCEIAGCALLGGETAEMPALYRSGHFDLAGFAVGVVERKRMIGNTSVNVGDELIGLESDGVHSNGYALARKVLIESAGLKLDQQYRGLNETLAAALLRPTRVYSPAILDVLSEYKSRPPISGMAHITGGGLPGNVSRFLSNKCNAVIRRGSWPIPPIFGLMQHHGVAEEEMYRVFNMGIGFVVAVRQRSLGRVMKLFTDAGERPHHIGRIKRGKGNVELQ